MRALANNDVKVLMEGGHFSDFNSGSYYRCRMTGKDFILIDENKRGYKCSKEDFYNDFSLVIGEYEVNDTYEYLDVEGNSVSPDDERRIIPFATPIIDICKSKITIDVIQRNGNIYVRAPKLELSDDKVYDSITASFNEHLLVIDKNGSECFEW